MWLDARRRRARGGAEGACAELLGRKSLARRREAAYTPGSVAYSSPAAARRGGHSVRWRSNGGPSRSSTSVS